MWQCCTSADKELRNGPHMKISAQHSRLPGPAQDVVRVTHYADFSDFIYAVSIQ